MKNKAKNYSVLSWLKPDHVQRIHYDVGDSKARDNEGCKQKYFRQEVNLFLLMIFVSFHVNKVTVKFVTFCNFTKNIFMSYLSAAMPKNPDKKRIEAHLMPDDYKRFEDLAKKENRSLKNHLETIILKYLEDQKKKIGKG